MGGGEGSRSRDAGSSFGRMKGAPKRPATATTTSIRESWEYLMADLKAATREVQLVTSVWTKFTLDQVD